VTIAGMGNGATGATTLFGEFDPDTGVLLIAEERAEKPGRPIGVDEDSMVATNIANLPEYDVLFDEDDMRAAIVAFFNLYQSGLVVLEQSVRHLNPQSKVEPDGVDEHGRKYRVMPDITNGQTAAIVMCWLTERVVNSGRQVEAMKDVPDLGMMTVGLPPEFIRAARLAMGGQAASTLPVSDPGMLWFGD